MKLAILSDIHYAGPAECARRDQAFDPIKNPLRRWLIRQYRRHVWLRDPYAHNQLLDRFLRETAGADLTIANGDYSCDTAYIGVSDDAAFQSAQECLGKLRAQFGDRFHATIGDHEIGKMMLGAHAGGLRLASYTRALQGLGLKPFWHLDCGIYRLIGVTSTLIALDLFEAEIIREELPQWQALRREHLEAVGQAFTALQPEQRVLLFCHDPSALPFLWEEEFIRAKIDQIERTVIGHLHTNAVYRQSLRLAGVPPIHFLGHTPKRISRALRQARQWAFFRPLLCPAMAGIQLLNDGGYYTMVLDPSGRARLAFTFHPLRRHTNAERGVRSAE